MTPAPCIFSAAPKSCLMSARVLALEKDRVMSRLRRVRVPTSGSMTTNRSPVVSSAATLLSCRMEAATDGHGRGSGCGGIWREEGRRAGKLDPREGTPCNFTRFGGVFIER